MIKVLATGVFNIIHPGHIFFLKESKKLGDELVVIVSSDNLANKISKKKVLPQDQRAKVVSELKSVDKVFVGDDEDIMALLPIIKPDVIVLGHDQDIREDWLEEHLRWANIKAKVIRLRNKLDGNYLSSTEIAKALSSK